MTRDNLFAYRARIANAEPLVNTRRVKIVRAGQSLNHFFWSPFTFTNHTFFSTAIFFEMFVETIYFVDKTKTSAFFFTRCKLPCSKYILVGNAARASVRDIRCLELSSDHEEKSIISPLLSLNNILAAVGSIQSPLGPP